MKFGIVGPNTAVKWLTFVFHIWEVPGSNLEPKTGYPEVLWISSVPPDELRDFTLELNHDHFLPNPF
jgi:hypothetical protein